MIGYLFGVVRDLSENNILVQTSGGVGYNVIPSGSLLGMVKKDGEFSAKIFTVVREQEITLYGFGSADEKMLFEKLIKVSGIGPKTALGMISVPVDLFMKSVENGDVAFLTKMPGIGKKTAERLIIELRGKINLKNPAKFSAGNKNFEEAIDALKNLGYDNNTINDVLSRAPDDADTEDLIKFFLSSGA